MKEQVVILAGGFGTRLGKLSKKTPKPMIPIAGKPFLYWQLLDVKQQGYCHVLLLISYLGDQIRNYFGDGHDMGLNISYSEEPEPMGTGGALRLAFSKLEPVFLLLNGDSFLHAPLKKMWDTFGQSRYEVMIATYHDLSTTPVPANIRTQGGQVVAYEKEAGRKKGFELIDSGIYVMRRRILEKFDAVKFDIDLILQDLIQQKTLGHFPVSEKFYDIGTPERILTFEEKIHDYF